MKEENQTIIKAINMFGRVPEMWELLNEIEKLNNIINKIEEHFVFLKMNSTGGNKEFFEDILDFMKALRELKGSDKQ